MAKFLTRLFSRGSSLHGSQSSLSEKGNRSKSGSGLRTSGSLENLASYHVVPKELEKNKLHKASWEGNLQKVARLARPGQINLKDQQMRTPIHLAVVKGHLDVVRYLVQENAKLDLIDHEQRTPLIKAVLSGNQNPQLNYQICQVLIDGGAGDSINAVDRVGKSALHYAIDFDNEQLVELFLSHENCNRNLQTRDRMTPLHLAIKRNNPQIVQSLLSDQHEQQADPNLTNMYGQTPLHLAASVGYVDIVRLLLFSNLREPCDPTILDSQQASAYQLAKANHQDACAKLIEEYEQKRYRPDPRRKTSTSMHDQLSMKATSSLSMTPAANLQHDPDETSENSSLSTTKPSFLSPKRGSDQWSDDNDPSISQPKAGIQSLFKTNPLQPDQTQKNTPSTVNQLFNNNPLETNAKKTTSSSDRIKSASFFGIGPVIERVDSENTSTSKSIDRLAKPSSQNKPTSILKPTANAKSWSDDTISASLVKKKEPRSNSWDTSASDDDPTISNSKKPSTKIPKKAQPTAASVIHLTSSDSDDFDSVETEIRKLDIEKPSNGTSANKAIGISKVQSPIDDESSWTTSPVPFNEQLPPQGVQNLVQRIKSDDSIWDDDSRPLGTDVSKNQTATGVNNLTKIMDTIIQSNKTQTPLKVPGKLMVSSMMSQTDSVFSDIDKKEWPVTSTHNNELKPNEQLVHSSVWTSDANSKRSSSSSFHDERINELKENIKKLERGQETAQELKRQLREMENKKNNFEKACKENDRLLRSVEDRVEQEKIDKQRLESTNKNLHNELKSIKQQLQELEDEKDLLNQRCMQLKHERDQYNDKLRAMQTTTNASIDKDSDQITSQHRESTKFLSAENENMHQRRKPFQPDLDSDSTARCKIDLERAIEEKIYYQRELDHLRSEKKRLEEEKLEYKTKYDGLQEEIRLILLDRSKLEQKLTGELQEHIQEKQRATDEVKKYRTQIEQLSIKLDDAEAHLQTSSTSKVSPSDTELRHSKNPLFEPLTVLTSTPLPNKSQHRILTSSLQPQSNIVEENYQFNQTYPQNENYLIQNSRQIRSDTERVKSELDHLREDFDRLISTYQPGDNYHHQTKLRSQIDTFRNFYQQEFRQRQTLMDRTADRSRSSTNTDSRLYKERLENAIDSSLSEQRLQTITQLPRQASALLTINTSNNGLTSSVELFRNHSNA